MQVVILCGGTGTRMKELTELTPKPLIPIGGRPLVWHIMKQYMYYNFFEFVLALGYKQEAFKMYFTHFDELNNDITVYRDIVGTQKVVHHSADIACKVTLADTGRHTLKGARLKRIEKYITDDTFMVTYGDGLSDINLSDLLAFHQSHGKLATLTGIHPRSKFGEIQHRGSGRVSSIKEKPKENGRLTNGGFMVFNKGIFNYLYPAADCDLEVGPFMKLVADKELFVYKHTGFWKSADTLKDIGELQDMWDAGNPPWQRWG